MSRVSGLAAWVAAAALGCSGYSQGASSLLDAATAEPAAPTSEPSAPPTPEEMHVETPQPMDAGHAQPPAKPATPKPPEPEPEPEPDPDPMAPHSSANLRLARTDRFDGYLTDAYGQALYMFTGDVAGASESACLDDCARAWLPFDVSSPRPSSQLAAEDVSRFHRQDGSWQTTYKGHPLYVHASELGSRDVSGDGTDSQWFVARDYLVFLSAARSFAPAGTSSLRPMYLTDGYGRTLYVCLDDQPRTAASEAVSTCDTNCTLKRPVFSTAETDRTTLLPSLFDPSELRTLVRTDGQAQLMYRGWPLYYYSGDTAVGSTDGHNDRAWRALDPISFGENPEPGSSY